MLGIVLLHVISPNYGLGSLVFSSSLLLISFVAMAQLTFLCGDFQSYDLVLLFIYLTCLSYLIAYWTFLPVNCDRTSLYHVYSHFIFCPFHFSPSS